MGSAIMMTALPSSSVRETSSHRYNLTAPVALLAFFITIPLLFSFEIAGLRLSPIRIYLLCAFLPTSLALFSRRAGPILAADLTMAGFALWIVVSLLINDGLAQLPNSVMTAIELYGGYLLGRVLIRNPQDFGRMTSIYLGILLILLPLVFIELLTGRIVLNEILGVTSLADAGQRMGLWRSQSGFEHPILYGLFCSSLAATIFYVYRQSGLVTTLLRLGLVATMTFMSLSSAPLLSLVAQVGLILWDRVTRGSWWLLIMLILLAYFAVAMASNRPPLNVFLTYATFDPTTAWTRLEQWGYGTVAVMDHPILGLGVGEKWTDIEKPLWLGDSVDSFWLLTAMRYGFVGFCLLAFSLLLLIGSVARERMTSKALRDMRSGYLISVVGIIFMLATVHIWGAVSIFIFFFIGSGAWLSDAARLEGPEATSRMTVKTDDLMARSAPNSRKTDLPTTRYAQDHQRYRGTPDLSFGAASPEQRPHKLQARICGPGQKI